MNKVYELITNQIIGELEKGQIPWLKPWNNGGPKNLATQKEYRGINTFLLTMRAFKSPYWLTFRQAKELGGHVKSGAKGTMLIFWKPFRTAKKETRIDENGKSKTVEVIDEKPVLRYFTVFNVEQCVGIKIPTLEKHSFNPIEKAQAIIDGYRTKPPITHSKTDVRAYYVPSEDRINMPLRDLFTGSEEYYSTLFHEMTHSTGHLDRLGRTKDLMVHFGDQDYSKEELVAELGSAFLCGESGIERTTIKNSSAYIRGWLKSLKDDRQLVVKAAAQAQKAVDYILGRVRKK